MPKSYRIRTEIGKDKAIHVNLEQDFEYLEILSLKILQSDIYTRVCSDYGVVVGRITANNGTGLPNCKVSIFIPLTQEDEENAIISELYPYKTLNDTNDEGYRYNLLPYTKSHGGHTPTGTFPTRNDVLINQTLIEVYDKYYKFTVKTNDSGDFMIFGVPLGTQTIHVDVDLSDIGEFSMTPQDLVRIGLATPNQISGTQFRSSSNLGELPQLLQFNRIIEVFPLWGQPEVCTLGITRTDFDLTEEAGITIQPAAVFMGSIFSNQDKRAVKRRCKVNRKLGNLCQLTAGPGEILAIRQTIGLDSLGYPVLEEYLLEEGGKVIDDNGTWLIDLPMNLEFVYTNEFGERTFSSDPKIGIPTKAKYRFKIKWEQPDTLDGKAVKRATFLVPNVKEWGWDNYQFDPYIDNPATLIQGCVEPDLSVTTLDTYRQVAASYAFSLNWNDYGAGPLQNQMIQEAINCEDRFYEFNYNKVYTIAELISEYRAQSGNKKFIAVRDVLEDTCESTNNPFPVNDAIFQFDLLYLLFSIAALIFKPIFLILIVVAHVVAWMVCKIRDIVCSKDILNKWCREWNERCEDQKIFLPSLVYPDCELCECSADPAPQPIGGSLGNPYNVSQPLPTTLSFNFTTGATLTTPRLSNIMTYNNPSNFACTDGGGTSSPTNKRSFTMSIPYSEKINLFNTKAKYFNEEVGVVNPKNPGGGCNRIKVFFNIDSSINQTQVNDPTSPAYHYDNVFAMILPPLPPFNDDTGETLGEIGLGDLLRFSKTNTSTDPNLNYYTGVTISGLNPFGRKSITGITDSTWTPFGTGYTYQKTFTYANYAAQSGDVELVTKSATYELFVSDDDWKTQRFGFDEEYLQVIYTGTVGSFIASSNSSNPNCFATRYLNGGMHIVTNEYDGNFTPASFFDPTLCSMSTPDGSCILLDDQTSTIKYPQSVISNYNNYRVVFCVRGVDPHSTRVKSRYDLSALFGDTLSTSGPSFNASRSVEFMAYLNIPIQPTLRTTKHNLSSSSDIDSYSNNYLYHDTFNFIPDPTQFQSFYSQKPFNYSSLDATNPGGAPSDAYELTDSSTFFPASTDLDVLTINRDNDYCRELWYSFTNGLPGGPNLSFYDNVPTPPITVNLDENELNTTTNGRNRGYFRNEVVEGGTILHIPSSTNAFTWDENAWVGVPLVLIDSCGTVSNSIPYGMPQHLYFGQKYNITTGLEINSGPSGRQLVMRSDRLPTSDIPNNTNPNGSLGGTTPVVLAGNTNSMIGFSNPFFNLNILRPEGEGPSYNPPSPSINAGDNQDNQTEIGGYGSIGAIASSFSCEGFVPLECYEVNSLTGAVTIKPPGDKCYTNNCCNDDRKTKCKDCNGENYMQYGCYTLLTDPWKSRKVDKYLMNEWLLRLRISFAACRNVWGHMFTNQWVNGTLFFYPIQTQTRYTSPGNDPNNPNILGPNQAYSCFCKHLVYFDLKTNNFYYRSAPYNSVQGFIGREGMGFKGNQRLLGNPTTIMDLGPVNDYMDELSNSEDFLGYVVNRLDSTSFQEVDEVLNLFIVQRIVSQGIRSIIKNTAKGGSNRDAVRRFFSRDNSKVDGDYAQMIAINSQIGVVPFDTGVYTDPSDIYFGRGDQDGSVFGIFFNANNQIRDWLSPKRTIVTPGGNPSFPCTFDEFPIFSQKIPMYLWQIKQNTGGAANDSIFGDQKNEWYTTIISGQFNNINYQSIYRDDISAPFGSRTMIPRQTDNESYYKGFIHNTLGNVNEAAQGAMGTEGPTKPSLPDRIVNNTAPYYFYFGLIKGSSAFDRFLTKWVKKDTNTF